MREEGDEGRRGKRERGFKVWCVSALEVGRATSIFKNLGVGVRQGRPEEIFEIIFVNKTPNFFTLPSLAKKPVPSGGQRVGEMRNGDLDSITPPSYSRLIQ